MIAGHAHGSLDDFDPRSWFMSGEKGLWHSLSDFGTLFQDAAGTVPVTAVGQYVGLVMDKSKGQPIGRLNSLRKTEDFSDGAWLKISSGTGVVPQLHSTNNIAPDGTLTAARFIFNLAGGMPGGSNASRIFQSAASVGGTERRVRSIWMKSVDGSTKYMYMGVMTGYGEGLAVPVTGEWTHIVVTDGESYGNAYSQLQFGLGYIEGTSDYADVLVWHPDVRPIGFAATLPLYQKIDTGDNYDWYPGNHAYQTDDTKRPILSALVNYFTQTDISEPPWNPSCAGTGVLPVITKNYGIAPDGTQTATRIVFNLGATPASAYSRMFTRANNAPTIDEARVRSLWVKTTDGTTKTLYRLVDYAFEPFTVTGDWTLYSTKDNSDVSATFAQTQFGLDGSVAGVSTSADVLVWGPDLRAANAGGGLPPTQLVNGETHGINGFPLYLKQNAAKTAFLVTSAIDLTGTDKVTVLAGIRKGSDTTKKAICELSSASATTNGTFALFAPGADGAATFLATSRGTALTDALASAMAAPRSAVLTMVGDIAGDSTVLRVNGVQRDADAGDQGSGNYGNLSLYIGMHDGYWYDLVVCGALKPADQLRRAEYGIARRMRIWL